MINFNTKSISKALTNSLKILIILVLLVPVKALAQRTVKLDDIEKAYMKVKNG